MSSSRWLHVLVALAMVASPALAGCLGGDADVSKADAAGEAAAEDADAAAAAAEEQARLNITDDGTRADNETLGHQPHLHDYWDGRERVTLLDDTIDPGTFNAIGFTFFEVFFRRQAAAGGAFATFPDGAIVYEGTGKLELTATWEDPKVTGLAVRYRSAAGPDFSDLVPLTPGTPLVVDVTPEMTDMPHMATSRWAFVFEPPGNGNAVLGPFHVKVDIVKMRDIGLFPGHPELFNGLPQKVILDADGRTAQQSFPTRVAGFLTGTGAPDEPSGLRAQEVVPMETVEMRVDLTINSATTSAGEASEAYLLYKSAETNGYRVAELVEGDLASGKLTYVIPVDMRMTDSPYAKESQWFFDVRVGSQIVPESDWDCTGCTDAQIDYHMTVTAFDAPQLTDGAAAEENEEDDGEGDAPAAPPLARPLA